MKAIRVEAMPLNKPICNVLIRKLKNKIQKIFWIYLCNNFNIKSMNDFKKITPDFKCKFTPITFDSCHRVEEFRERDRIAQYRDKLAHKEIGFFAEHDEKVIGSIWATINKAEVPKVVRTYMKLIPNQGLIHDIVTGDQYRGMGVGPFMVSRIASKLLKEYGLSGIIIDVNIKNRSSLRMMEKLGLRIDTKTLYVSALGRLVLQFVLKRYA